MILRDPDEWRAARLPERCPADRAATPRGVFLVQPEGFSLAPQSAQDNRYMAMQEQVSAERALAQHRALQRALASERPAIAFAGDPATPDAVFPNNVFATTQVDGEPRLIVGRMRHPVRQREAERPDIRSYFRDLLGYAETDLSGQPHPCELTGALVIDRAHGIGFCGLSERCDEAGAALMHAAFGLRVTLMFDLAPGEYHTNVLLAVLAGRAALVCPHALQGDVSRALHALYGPHVVTLSPAEQADFAGNAIALTDRSVWMSRRAHHRLAEASRRQLEEGAGFTVRSVPLEAIEAGGGSLRCCVAEIF